jgi:hypothetical protein
VHLVETQQPENAYEDGILTVGGMILDTIGLSKVTVKYPRVERRTK